MRILKNVLVLPVAILLATMLSVGVLLVSVRSTSAAEVDLDFAPLVFDYAHHTNISPATPDCDAAGSPCVGMVPGDIVRFDSVATVGGTVIDAVVTTLSCTTASVTRYEVSSSWVTSNEYFKVRQDITAGGMCTYRFEFFVGSTYTGPDTGTAVTIRNLQLTALEIDNRQWVEFSHFDGYTLTTDTELTFDPVNKRFQSTNEDGGLDSAPFQVVVTYSAVHSLTVGFGRQTSAGTNNFALAFQALPFDGHDTVEHGEVIAETPDPIDEGTPVPEIGWITEPPVDPSIWTVPPTCAAYAVSDVGYTTPLRGAQPAGVYVTHCDGGESTSFVPLDHIDGTLVVRAVSAPVFTG